MPGPFTITPSSTLITLEDDKRQGTVAFTVKNDTVRRIRATARLVLPPGSPAETWLAILQPGDPSNPPELPGTVRLFDLGETETYLIKIAAPNDAVPSSHTFRLVVADETNPDELFSESTDVTVVLNKKPDPPPPPPKFPIWIIPVVLVVLVIIALVIILLTRPTPSPAEPTATPTATAQPVMQLQPGTPTEEERDFGSDMFLGSDPFPLFFANFRTEANNSASGVDSFGRACSGFITTSPNYRVGIFNEPSSQLAFFFQGDGRDNTMLILDPQGNVHCNDNAEGFEQINPGIAIEPVLIGDYFIWIGSNDFTRLVNGSLFVMSDCRHFFQCTAIQ